jgi:16S rRNA (cytosine967-C5)-methyltransferase
VYCTCSVFKIEGHHQAQAFQSRHTNALRLASPGQLLPRHAKAGEVFTHNLPCDHDGFYFARFQKQA